MCISPQSPNRTLLYWVRFICLSAAGIHTRCIAITAEVFRRCLQEHYATLADRLPGLLSGLLSPLMKRISVDDATLLTLLSTTFQNLSVVFSYSSSSALPFQGQKEQQKQLDGPEACEAAVEPSMLRDLQLQVCTIIERYLTAHTGIDIRGEVPAQDHEIHLEAMEKAAIPATLVAGRDQD